MKNLSIAKKFCILVILAGMLFPSFGARKAEAWIDVVNLVPNWITGIATPATTVTTGATAVASTVGWTWSAIGKNLLDAAAYKMGQLLLNKLTENTIAWIRGGFHGSPSFAVDMEEIEQDMIDAIAGDLINQVKDLSVCQFSVNYTDDLTDSILLSTKKKKAKHIPVCPVDLSMNFYASDAATAVNSFGWSALGSALSASGNPYIVQVATAEELAQRQQDTKTKSDKKLSWSNGYTDILDTSDCSYPENIANRMDPAWVSAHNMAPLPPALVQTYQKKYCKTTTPGAIIGNQLSETTGIDMKKLGFIDNMNKIFGALLDTLTQKAVRGVFKAAGLSGSQAAHTTTVSKLSVDTMDATSVTKDSVALRGAIMSNSITATAWFEWGTTSSFGNETAGKTLYGVTELVSTYNDETLNDLSPNTKYYYRAVAKDALGRKYGVTLNFTTNQ